MVPHSLMSIKSRRYTREEVLAVVTQDGMALEHFFEFRSDEEVVLAAVTQNGQALKYASPALRGNKRVALAAVTQYGDALEHASLSILSDEEVILAAVKQNGNALYFADEAQQGNKEVVLAAVKQYGLALRYASDELQRDMDVVWAALTEDPSAREFVPVDLKYAMASMMNPSNPFPLLASQPFWKGVHSAASPAFPSVIKELGIGTPPSRLRQSCVAKLLATPLAGMASDATLDMVLQRVNDCGLTQDLVDCSILDGCGLEFMLEEEHGIVLWPPERVGPFDSTSGRARLMESFIPRLSKALDIAALDDWDIFSDKWAEAEVELAALAKTAVEDLDHPVFTAVCDAIKEVYETAYANTVYLCGASWMPSAIVARKTLLHSEAEDKYLRPLVSLGPLGSWFSGHSEQCFEELLLPLLLDCVADLHEPASWLAPLLNSYSRVAPRALAREWEGSYANLEELLLANQVHGPPHAMQGVAYFTLKYMMRGEFRDWPPESTDEFLDWQSIGEFLRLVRELNPTVGDNFHNLFAYMSKVASTGLISATPPVQLPPLRAVTEAECLAWRVAAVVWGARRKRLLELRFLDWLEESNIYKPIVVDGKPRAPKRARDEFEAMERAVRLYGPELLC